MGRAKHYGKEKKVDFVVAVVGAVSVVVVAVM